MFNFQASPSLAPNKEEKKEEEEVEEEDLFSPKPASRKPPVGGVALFGAGQIARDELKKRRELSNS